MINSINAQRIMIPITLFKTFTYRGWFCTIQESWGGGYRIDAVAMTQQFLIEYNKSNSTINYASNFKHCGKFITFNISQWLVGYERAIKKAQAHIDQYIGAAPIL